MTSRVQFHPFRGPPPPQGSFLAKSDEKGGPKSPKWPVPHGGLEKVPFWPKSDFFHENGGPRPEKVENGPLGRHFLDLPTDPWTPVWDRPLCDFGPPPNGSRTTPTWVPPHEQGGHHRMGGPNSIGGGSRSGWGSKLIVGVSKEDRHRVLSVLLRDPTVIY